MKTLSIDIETYSDVSLQKTGVYRYVESPNFEILLFAYSVDSQPVQVIDLACGEQAIADELNADGIASKKNSKWTATTIRAILANEKYTGDVIFQKTYTDENFNRHINCGEIDQYMAPDHHEAIISHEDFDAANALVAQRASEKGIEKGNGKYQQRYAFSGKIICGECGDTFKRRIHPCTTYKYVAWPAIHT